MTHRDHVALRYRVRAARLVSALWRRPDAVSFSPRAPHDPVIRFRPFFVHLGFKANTTLFQGSHTSIQFDGTRYCPGVSNEVLFELGPKLFSLDLLHSGILLKHTGVTAWTVSSIVFCSYFKNILHLKILSTICP